MTARRLHYDYADYLRTLELSVVKLEFCDGEIYAMAGGTPASPALSFPVDSVYEGIALDRPDAAAVQ